MMITRTRNRQLGDLTKNFSRHEFECLCGDCGLDTVDYQLLAALQAMRDECEKPIKITSAFRCEDHNNGVGGKKNSYHLHGKAADIQIEGMTPDEVAELAEKTDIIKGIGVYGTFTHIDVRDYKARWRG